MGKGKGGPNWAKMGRNAARSQSNDRRRQQQASDRAERQMRSGSSWQGGGTVDGEAARTRQDGDRTDALWGGSRGNQKGDGHGHIATNDGLNASHVRYPGGEVVVNQKDDSDDDPYEVKHEGWH